jgi:hypothetical protein
LGSFIFFTGGKADEYLKKKNSENAYFPYQKVVMPILLLIIMNIIFYFLTK